ncbi:MAG: methylated-DNA--[protein]-cysteine S-methyltransferase, partial [Chromatiales bacterium]|nr:methylated-DNA--[protein]-cysteine S-methyltransferase [Chromatiales bacterium]
MHKLPYFVGSRQSAFAECDVIATPVGELIAAVDRDGNLTHLVFGPGVDRRSLAAPVHAAAEASTTSGPVIAALRSQLSQYFSGDVGVLDSACARWFGVISLRFAGTPWQCTVWAGLRSVRPGRTQAYGDFAAALGKPSAARAVGAANGQNPFSIVVPCHRLVGADGSLTGYAGGLAAKRWLLDF